MQHIPFDYEKKGTFGVKVVAYLVSGFAIPFVAAYYQLYVSSLVLSGLWGVGGGRLTRAAGASPLARHRSRLARTYRRPANLYMLHPARNRRLDGRAFCNITRALPQFFAI